MLAQQPRARGWGVPRCQHHTSYDRGQRHPRIQFGAWCRCYPCRTWHGPHCGLGHPRAPFAHPAGLPPLSGLGSCRAHWGTFKAGQASSERTAHRSLSWRPATVLWWQCRCGLRQSSSQTPELSWVTLGGRAWETPGRRPTVWKEQRGGCGGSALRSVSFSADVRGSSRCQRPEGRPGGVMVGGSPGDQVPRMA